MSSFPIWPFPFKLKADFKRATNVSILQLAAIGLNRAGWMKTSGQYRTVSHFKYDILITEKILHVECIIEKGMMHAASCQG
jgi:hypothetical protein